MPNTKRTITAIVLTFTAALSHAQTPATKYSFPQVGWTMFLPATFKVVDSATSADLQQKGKKILEDANSINVDISSTRTLITARKNAVTTFNSTIRSYNPNKEGDYATANQQVKTSLCKALAAKSPNAKIDTSSSSLVIDGLAFDKFYLQLTLGARVLFHMVILSKYYKGYDWGITYLYNDDVSKAEIESILTNSKFGR